MVDISSIIKHYEKCLESSSDPFIQVDWTNKNAALKRYQFILDILENEYIDSVCDFGCGTGLLAQKMRDYGVSGIDYLGVDISEKMILEANKIQLPKEFNFKVFNPSDGLKGTFDAIVANGVFTEKRDLSNEEMYKHLASTLDMIKGNAKKFILVNFMNPHSLPSDKRREELFFLSLDKIAALSYSLGFKGFNIYSSYLPYEYMVKLCQ